MRHGDRIILALLLACASLAVRAAEVMLVDAGVAKTVIVAPARVMAPDDPKINVEAFGRLEPQREFQRRQLRAAVNDLAQYFEKMSGARVGIVTDPAKTGNLTPIYIGELATAKYGQPQQSAPFAQGFRMVVTPAGVGLAGESDLGTSYAIYEVLDRLGCRWFMPTEMGECIPSMKTIALPEMDYNSAPGTIYRSIWAADWDFKRRNRCGGMPLNASHALENYIPKETLAKHPEWIAVYQGKPVPPLTKWTRPEIADAMSETIIKYFDTGVYQWSASLSPEDGLAFDESEDPQFDAGDFDPQFGMNSLSDRLLILCNRIADRVTKKYPDALFGFNAYVNYTRPPVREKMHPNLVPVIAPITYCRAHPVTDDGDPGAADLRRSIEGWGKAARMTGVYFFAMHLAEQSAPYPMIREWSVNVPYVLKNNCQFFQPETTANFETTMHGLWLGMRLAWNPNQQPADIVNEINTRFYGNAAAEMAAYWDLADRCWVETPEYSGAGHGHMKRFTPERMAKLRELMDAAKAKAKTPEEKARITLADESLKIHELYMKMRQDLAAGRWTRLSADADQWVSWSHAMAERYRAQYCFSARDYGAHIWGNNNGVDGFNTWYHATCDDATRIATHYQILSDPPIRQWRFQADTEKKGEALGWAKPGFDDTAWRATDPVVDSWSSLGFHNYFGRMWYRTTVDLPAAKAGQRTYLWLGAVDGSAKVYVNGKLIPYTAPDGKKTDVRDGFMTPASWNISGAVKTGANQITILSERTGFNEVGTGGIMAPAAVYRER